MNLGYITNGRNKLRDEQMCDNISSCVLKMSDEEIDAKSLVIQNNIAILDSYKLKQMKISPELEQELLERGMSQGERICTGCHNIIQDVGFCRCEPCRMKQRKSANNYYNLKTKVRK